MKFLSLIFLILTSSLVYGQAIEVDQSGNVGIGTATPSAALEISKATDNNLRFIPSSASTFFIQANSTSATSAQNLVIGSRNRDTLTIANASGNIGIGTTNPSAALEISKATDNNLRFVPSSASTFFIQSNSTSATSGQNIVLGSRNRDTLMVQNTTGNIGIGTASPTQALEIASGNVMLSTTGVNKLGIFKNFAAGGFTGCGIYDYSALGFGIGTTGPIVFVGTTSGNTEIARFNTNGQLGIGTNAQNCLLDLRGAKGTTNTTVNGATSSTLHLNDFEAGVGAGPQITFSTSYPAFNSATVTGAAICSYKESSSGTDASQYNHALVFKTSNYPSGPQEKVRIDSTGNVLLSTGNLLLSTSGVNQIAMSKSFSAGGFTGTGLFNYTASGLGLGSAGPIVFVGTASGNTEIARFDGTGKLGIGTTSPTEKLEVNGNIKISGNVTVIGNSSIQGSVLEGANATTLGGAFRSGLDIGGNNTLFLTDDSSVAAGVGGGLSFGGKYSGSTKGIFAKIIGVKDNATSGDSAGNLRFFTSVSGGSSFEHVRILSTGNVGIGTTTPSEKLEVNGSVKASSFKVGGTTLNVPDYVFEEGYKLRTLDEVQSLITEKGHLPGIPSAKEINLKGLDIADMQLKLLEKVEELTLYTIDQHKQLQNQNLEIQKLKVENTILKDKEKVLEEMLKRIEKLERK